MTSHEDDTHASTAYVEVHTLRSGHSDTVNCLSFSPDGIHLASGGDDYALMIWNAQKGRLLYRFLCKAPVGCVIWHPMYPETVIVGCDNGYLFQAHDFHLKDYTEDPIHLGAQGTVQCLEYDGTSQYLAIGMGSEVYVSREVVRNEYKGAQKYPPPANADETSIDSDTRVRPVSLHFLNSGEQLIVSYLNHGIICWDTHSQDELWIITPPEIAPKIGGSALSPNARTIAVYNMTSGLDRYVVGGKGKRRQSYTLDQPPRSKLTMRTSFLHDGRAIICGSTTGNVCIWNVANGEHFQVLRHDDDVVQAIATCARAPYHYIATGSAGKGQDTYIKIWRAKISSSVNKSHALTSSLEQVVQTLTRSHVEVHDPIAHGIVIAFTVLVCFSVAWACAILPWRAIGSTLVDSVIIARRYSDACASQITRVLLDLGAMCWTIWERLSARLQERLRQTLIEFLFPNVGGPAHGDL